MAKISESMTDFMAKFGVLAGEMWEVRGNAWAIKHAALERVAAEQGIKFDRPSVIEAKAAEKIAVVCVFGTMGDRQEWSFGEASPANNKNSYCYAMAEKRAKDRVILKLLNGSQMGIYSDEESDDFKRPNPHVTRPADIVPEVEYDEHGQPVDNIPVGDERIERLPKAKARTIYAELQAELLKIQDPIKLKKWGDDAANRVESLPSDWQEVLRGQYAEHLHSIRNGRAA